MRVLDSGTLLPSYNMGKSKKHKLRKGKENDVGGSDSSDEGATGGGCSHINRSVNFAQMRKAVLKQVMGECTDCSSVSKKRQDSPTGTASRDIQTEEVQAGDDYEPTLWVCLQCGHQGCDRNSKEKHALKHHEAPRSSCHCTVMNTTTWAIWCYMCDDEVQMESSKRLHECYDFLQKEAGVPGAGVSSSSVKRVPSQTENDLQTSNKQMVLPRGTASSVPCQKVKGLSNLGNTCFFNAVMQNLCQTPILENVLMDRTKKGKTICLPGRTVLSDSDTNYSSENDSEDDIPCLKDMPPLDVTAGDPGPLTLSLLSFLQEMNNTSSRSRYATVNPGPLFGQVCKKAPRFKGFQQQDSHELLRYVLDVSRTEEIKAGQTGILKHFNINPKKVDEELKVKIKEYGKQVKHTIIDSVFGGQLVSTIKCEECQFVSQVFEPFLDLSLPLAEEKPQRPTSSGGRKKDRDEPEPEVITSLENGDDISSKYKPYSVSKHESKKKKKQAKKEAKRRKSKTGKGKPIGGEKFGDAEERDEENKLSADSDNGKDEVDGIKIVNGEQNLSDKDDPSDADVEDNDETDVAKQNYHFPTDTLCQASSTPIKAGSSDCYNNGVIQGNTSPVLDEDKMASPSSLTYTSPSLMQNHENFVSNLDYENGIDTKTDGLVANELACDTKSGYSVLNHNSCDNSLCKRFAGLDISEKEEGNEHFQDNYSFQHSSNCCSNEQALEGGHVLENGIDSIPKGLIENCHVKFYNDVSESRTDLFDKSLDGFNSEQREGGAEAMCHNARNSFCKDFSTSITDIPKKSETVKTRKQLKREAQLRSMSTLIPRYLPSARECSVMSCLHQFTSAELLTGNNKFACPSCNSLQRKIVGKKDKIYTNASKQFLIFTAPAILTLHMKRFEQVGYTSRKVNRHVDFPFVLNLSPFISSMSSAIKLGQKKVLYALYGVVEHSGRLSGGHYTAYVKVRPNNSASVDFLQAFDQHLENYRNKYAENSHLFDRSSIESLEASFEEDNFSLPGKWYHISDSRVSESSESSVQRAQAYLLFYERLH